MKNPVVKIENMNFSESSFRLYNKVWKASTLYEEVKKQKLKAFNCPLASIDLSRNHFDLENMNDFIFQCKRVYMCDKKKPIVLDNLGRIADGYHRVCRAILDGDTTIRAYRLNSLPEPDKIEKENE